MKKTLIIFAGILLGTFIVFSLLDTSEYALEKRIWRVQKQYDQMAKDPKVVPDQEFEDMIFQYRNIVTQYPKSSLAPQVHLQIGRTYILRQDYTKAREAFQEVVETYPGRLSVGAEALSSIGNTYEIQGEVAMAVQTYRRVSEEYTKTELGLNMPLYIANYYLRLNKPTESATALQNAVNFYKKISRENPQSPLEFNSLRLLVTAYFAQEQWNDGVNVLSRLLLEYPSREYLTLERANLIIKAINTVAVTQLKDYDIPINIYQTFIARNPDHPLNNYLLEVIKSLQLLKDQKVIISTEESK